ncbi:MAG TPA: PAS domain S-box protein, partial [Verrucomicrobiae bacterium]|nr:PAS domain S-box protein [Verrucomicrobiae bacterium]
LQRRDEELSLQNEELQVQAEELQSQAEELQSQTEELQAQTEELVVQAEELRNSEERFRSLFDTAAVGMAKIDLRGAFLTVNDALCRMTGYPRDELLRMREFDLSHPEEAAERAREFDFFVRGESSALESQRRLLCRDGREIWVQLSGCFLRDSRGNRTAMVAVVQDVTARRAAELALRRNEMLLEQRVAERTEELQRSEQLLRTVLENLPVGVTMYDRSGEVAYCNGTAREIWGNRDIPIHRFIEYRGWWHDSGLPLQPEDWGAPRAFGRGIRSAGQVLDVEAEGGRKTIVDSAVPVLAPDGTITGAVAVCDEITHETELQKQLLQSQKMETIGQLAGGIAHDFNNILMVMLGFTECAADAASEPEVRDLLRQVLESGARATELTRKLLTFSRQQVIQKRGVEVDGLIIGLMKLLRRILPDDITVEVIPSGTCCTIDCDPVQIEQVITNMVVNARDAMPHGGMLRLTADPVRVEGMDAAALGVSAGEYVRVRVSDTGTGIEEHIIDKVFDPFFTTKEVGKGTGLGLSMAYGIVRQHSGTITVESRPGEGSVFTIHLPAVPETSVVPPVGEPAASEGRILLVEDDPALLKYIRMALGAAGYHVKGVGSGEEALRAAEKARFDLLVTDV